MDNSYDGICRCLRVDDVRIGCMGMACEHMYYIIVIGLSMSRVKCYFDKVFGGVSV